MPDKRLRQLYITEAHDAPYWDVPVIEGVPGHDSDGMVDAQPAPTDKRVVARYRRVSQFWYEYIGDTEV